jgi:dienelactone hydrolase
MRSKHCAAVVIVGLVALSGIFAHVSAQDDETASAKELVELLVKKDWKAAFERFSDELKQDVTAETLEKAVSDYEKRFGAWKDVKETRVEKETARGTPVLVVCRLEKGLVGVRVTSKKKVVTGIHFGPLWSPPAYVKEGSFTEKDITVGFGEYALPGTLTLPVGEGPFPGVVFVHGSGGGDRDESLEETRPFKDVAQGLASVGIASLRYDKRTHMRAITLKMLSNLGPHLTVKEEVIDDALTAIHLLRKQAKIDRKRTFLLGHSLGGMLAPRIAKDYPELAGVIVWAGCGRPFEDVWWDQMEFSVDLAGYKGAAREAALKPLKKQFDLVKSPDLSVETPGEQLPFGGPARYWLDIRNSDAPGLAKTLRQPFLVLQGERDFNVTLADFELWKKALADRKDCELKTYPLADHALVDREGKGRCNPRECQVFGHVNADAVADIAAFIKR